MTMLLMNKVVRHIFVCFFVVIHQLSIYGYGFYSYIVTSGIGETYIAFLWCTFWAKF